MFFLVKRAGTVQPSLFLPKFSLFFLASCWKWRVLKSSRALPLRTSTATPRHSGQNWTGCSTISLWSMHRWCWEGRRSIIFPSAVTMAGWKIELSDDLTQTVPAYRWSQISTVSGHCLHFRSICSSKNCFAYQSSLVKSGKPPFNSCLCPKQGKNMVYSGRMHQRKQQIKPRQNRIYKRFIVAFLVVEQSRTNPNYFPLFLW